MAFVVMLGLLTVVIVVVVVASADPEGFERAVAAATGRPRGGGAGGEMAELKASPGWQWLVRHGKRPRVDHRGVAVWFRGEGYSFSGAEHELPEVVFDRLPGLGKGDTRWTTPDLDEAVWAATDAYQAAFRAGEIR